MELNSLKIFYVRLELATTKGLSKQLIGVVT
jgi:hypothetical protein